RRQVEIAESVTRDDEERLVEPAGREADRTGGAERRFLDRVADVQSERVALAEVAADRLREERHRHDHVRQAVLAQELEDVLHARLADDRDHRLRLVGRERTKARSLATRHDDGLHRRDSLRAVMAYTTPAATARTRPAQKIQYGQWVLSGVTIRNPMPA